MQYRRKCPAICRGYKFDFYMERDGERFLREVNGCTLADNLQKGAGHFPDASTVKGIRHLNELAKAAKAEAESSVFANS